MLSRVNPPLPWKAPTITVTVGTSRKIARYARKGSRPAQGAIRDSRATAQPTALAQLADRYLVAFSVYATVGVTAWPLTGGHPSDRASCFDHDLLITAARAVPGTPGRLRVVPWCGEGG